MSEKNDSLSTSPDVGRPDSAGDGNTGRGATAKRAKSNARAPRRWLKRSALLLLVVAVGALLVVSWMPKPVPIDIVALAREPMQVTVDEDGRARVRDRYVVSAPLGGRVARLELNSGDAVKRGDIVARIAPLQAPLLDVRSRKSAEAQVAAASAGKGQIRAQIVRAEATLAYAAAEVVRLKQLVQNKAVSTHELEQAVLAERTAAADLESLRFSSRVADHELQMARATLQRSDGDGEELSIPSPVDGHVLKLIQQSEGVVPAGAQLLEVGDASGLEIVVDVLTSDAVSIRPGAKTIIDEWGGEPLHATVRKIEPSAFTRMSALGVEEQRVNVVIDLDGEPKAWAALGDGYRVEARIVVWASEDTLTVPSSAVFRHGQQWAVYRVVDNHVLLTEIDVGHRNARVVEVESGLELPASVVLHPSDRIKDGVEVVAR